jgi:hypothetical protein
VTMTARPDLDSPSRNDGVTMAGAACPVRECRFRLVGRRRFCCKRRASPALVSDACRQAAWRRLHSSLAPVPLPTDGAARSARSATVYECPSCGARYLGEQRCPDCQRFCRRVGPGRPLSPL